MKDAVDELRENVSRPFDAARAMPPSVYTSEAFLQREIEDIFAQDWFCAGRASSLPGAGDYLTLDLANQPVIVLRDGEGALRAMANVCRHRMSTLLEGRGTVRRIVCPYHAWTYNLDGSLRGAPAMEQNTGFCKSENTLPEIRCEEWQGWIFVTLNCDAPPVAGQLATLNGMIGDFGMAEYTETFTETHLWDTNWKVLAENFMESYHLPVCHAGTIGGLSKLEEMVCPPGEAAFNYHTILKDDTLKIALAHPENTRLTGERRRMTYLIAIYPGLMITLTPGYFWYLSLHPKGPGQVQISHGGGMSPEFINDPDARAQLDQLRDLLKRVNEEDRGCTEKVYRGLCSASARPGPLSHLERPNYDFAKYIYGRIAAAAEGGGQ
ncbi:SRPBCC family protein [Roseobacter sp.]|uniref:aromatic ring-hydroxylating oxygenase subunit alpha n=1 Tax=Roseobacter sp. TaxID=1907202 RepID=UPI0025D3F5E1|nr:SRPBCC family protein [Roseobacter sp.]